MSRTLKNVVLGCLLVQGTWLLAATDGTTSGESNRMKKQSGAYIGLLGDPFPTVVGVNISYNALDFLRVNAGFGQVSASTTIGTSTASATATTMGLGTRFFVPGWNFSPVAGLSFAHVSVSNEGGASVSVKNFSESSSHLYATLGFDWQAANGFNVGAGYNVSFKSGVGGLPYVNVGWFFDLI